VVGRSLAAVADQVPTTDHLTNGEETNDLSSGDTGKGKLLGAGVADTGQEVLGRGEADGLEGGGVASDVDQRLEVGLESGHVAGERISIASGGEQRGIIFGLKIPGQTYGGAMFWPRKTRRPSSMPTLE